MLAKNTVSQYDKEELKDCEVLTDHRVIANQWCSAQRINNPMIASGNRTAIYRRLVWQSVFLLHLDWERGLVKWSIMFTFYPIN